MHTSIEYSKPLYRYLIGVYENYNNMKSNKKDTKIQNSTQESIKGLVDGYYFILATYTKDIP